MRGRQAAGRRPCSERCASNPRRRRLSRDDRRARRVLAGDVEPSGISATDRVGVGPDSEHRASGISGPAGAFGESLSASSRAKTPARQAATYSPTEWPIMPSGSIPEAPPCLCQRVLDHEQGRLGDFGLCEPFRLQAFGSRLRIEDVAQLEVELRPQEARAFVDIGTERRITLVRPPAHVHRLGSLSREQKRDGASSRLLDAVSALLAIGSARAGRIASSVPRATSARRYGKRRRPVWSVNATSASRIQGG